MFSSTARYLSEVLVSSVKETANTSMSVLNLCLKNKKYAMMFITCNVILPIVNAEVKKLIFDTKCGAFETFKTDNKVNDFTFFSQLGEVCFAALTNSPEFLFCKLPEAPIPQEGQLIMTIHNTRAESEICSNYYRLRDDVTQYATATPNRNY